MEINGLEERVDSIVRKCGKEITAINNLLNSEGKATFHIEVLPYLVAENKSYEKMKDILGSVRFNLEKCKAQHKKFDMHYFAHLCRHPDEIEKKDERDLAKSVGLTYGDEGSTYNGKQNTTPELIDQQKRELPQLLTRPEPVSQKGTVKSYLARQKENRKCSSYSLSSKV